MNDLIKGELPYQFKIPTDVDLMRIEYEGRIPKEGTCGPTLIAFLIGKTVKEVIENWSGLFSSAYRGYCCIEDLEVELHKYDIETIKRKSLASHDFVFSKDMTYAIAMIVWDKKWCNYEIPEKNTHFVFMGIIRDELWLYDNTAGWFKPDSNTGKSYMSHGKIKEILVLDAQVL